MTYSYMERYTKIQTLFERDPETKYSTVLEGQFSLDVFRLLKDIEWIGTEKVDGTNTRVMWTGEELRFGGKKENSQIPTHLLEALQNKFDAGSFRDKFGDTPACLYGEGFGDKIQKVGDRYNPDGADFILFDVKVGEWWLDRSDVIDVANSVKCDVVPEVYRGDLQGAVEMVKEGFDSLVSEQQLQAEGLILKPSVELRTKKGDRIITKLKTKDFK